MNPPVSRRSGAHRPQPSRSTAPRSARPRRRTPPGQQRQEVPHHLGVGVEVGEGRVSSCRAAAAGSVTSAGLTAPRPRGRPSRTSPAPPPGPRGGAPGSRTTGTAARRVRGSARSPRRARAVGLGPLRVPGDRLGLVDLALEESPVCSCDATCPVGRWCSSTLTQRRRNIFHAAAAYSASGREVRASSSTGGVRWSCSRPRPGRLARRAGRCGPGAPAARVLGTVRSMPRGCRPESTPARYVLTCSWALPASARTARCRGTRLDPRRTHRLGACAAVRCAGGRSHRSRSALWTATPTDVSRAAARTAARAGRGTAGGSDAGSRARPAVGLGSRGTAAAATGELRLDGNLGYPFSPLSRQRAIFLPDKGTDAVGEHLPRWPRAAASGLRVISTVPLSRSTPYPTGEPQEQPHRRAAPPPGRGLLRRTRPRARTPGPRASWPRSPRDPPAGASRRHRATLTPASACCSDSLPVSSSAHESSSSPPAPCSAGSEMWRCSRICCGKTAKVVMTPNATSEARRAAATLWRWVRTLGEGEEDRRGAGGSMMTSRVTKTETKTSTVEDAAHRRTTVTPLLACSSICASTAGSGRVLAEPVLGLPRRGSRSGR